jgi:hypothetical protein
MKKFEGWRTAELQYIATIVAGRDMEGKVDTGGVVDELYNQVIREIRNRRIAEELFQMKLKGIEEE